jgi:hypothetical protein
MGKNGGVRETGLNLDRSRWYLGRKIDKEHTFHLMGKERLVRARFKKNHVRTVAPSYRLVVDRARFKTH